MTAKICIGNLKLSSFIHTFSLPEGEDATCPGETPTCRLFCYAKKGHFRNANVQALYEENFKQTQRADFHRWMTQELRRNHVKVLRIHVSGDFYDNAYVRKWINVIEKNQHILFFAYTRSWQTHTGVSRRLLQQLANLPNMRMWYSCDADTGEPPRHKNVNFAYLATPKTTSVPEYADLVFRTHRTTIAKTLSGKIVCPAENGGKVENRITCGNCKLCWAPDTRNKLVTLNVRNTKTKERPEHAKLSAIEAN